MKKDELLNPDTPMHSSSVYLAFLILKKLMKQDQLSIVELHSFLKKEAKNYTYTSVINSLLFLYSTGVIDFEEPYIYKTKI